MVRMMIDGQPSPTATSGDTITPIAVGDTEYVTLGDAAASVGVPVDRVAAWRRVGRIAGAVEMDGRWWIPLHQVQTVEADLRRVHVHEQDGVLYMSPELAAAILTDIDPTVTPKRVYDWNRSRKLPSTIKTPIGRTHRVWVLLDECRTALASSAGRGRPRTAVPAQRTPHQLTDGLTLRHRRYVHAATS